MPTVCKAAPSGARGGWPRSSDPAFGVARKLTNREGLPAAAGLARHTSPEAEKAGVSSSVPSASRPAITARTSLDGLYLPLGLPSCSPARQTACPSCATASLPRGRSGWPFRSAASRQNQRTAGYDSFFLYYQAVCSHRNASDSSCRLDCYYRARTTEYSFSKRRTSGLLPEELSTRQFVSGPVYSFVCFVYQALFSSLLGRFVYGLIHPTYQALLSDFLGCGPTYQAPFLGFV